MIKKIALIDSLPCSYYSSILSNSNDRVCVFLHGRGGSGKSFSGMRRELDDLGLSWIAIDLPGFGDTPRPVNTRGVLDYAMFVHNIMIKIGIKSVILIGHSFGGQVAAQLMSIDHPDFYIEKVVLLAPAIVRRKPSALMQLYFAFLRTVKLFIPRSIVQYMSRRMSSSDYLYLPGMRDIFRKVIQEDQTEAITKSMVPITIVAAKNDADVRHNDLLKLVGPHVAFVGIDGGHYDVLSTPLKNLLSATAH